MNKWIANALGIAAIAVLGVAVWGGIGLTRHVIVAFDAWGAAAPNLQPTLDAISGPRGTLWQANKAIVKVGDAIVTTQLQERAITPHTIAAVDSLATIGPHANSVLDSSKLTLDAATGTLHSASETLAEGKRTIAAAQPVLEAFTQDATDLDALLKDHAIHDTLDNTATITGNMAGVSHNLDLISGHLEKTLDAPVPFWRQLIPGTVLAGKLYACAVHHVCVN